MKEEIEGFHFYDIYWRCLKPQIFIYVCNFFQKIKIKHVETMSETKQINGNIILVCQNQLSIR